MKKILLVPDCEGWAFDNRANALMRHIEGYQFDKVFWKDMPEKDYSEYDLIYYMGFYMMGTKRDKAKEYYRKEKTITSMTGLVNWSLEETIPFFDKACAVSVMNEAYREILINKIGGKIFVTPNGVNTDLFKPLNFIKDGMFTIGWAGNRKHKGKRVDELQEVVDSIDYARLKIQDREEKIPHYIMPNFYNQLDCYCCPSSNEGSNNSVLEAMACGVPVISTPAGNAKQLLSSGGGILIDEELNGLRDAILRMKTEFDERFTMGMKARSEILKNWSWAVRSQTYKEMFDYACK